MLSPGQVSEGKAQVAAAHQAQKRDLGKGNLSSVFTCKVDHGPSPIFFTGLASNCKSAIQRQK